MGGGCREGGAVVVDECVLALQRGAMGKVCGEGGPVDVDDCVLELERRRRR